MEIGLAPIQTSTGTFVLASIIGFLKSIMGLADAF